MTDDPPSYFPHRSTGREPQEQLLAKLIASLDGDPAYEPYGDPITSMWDTGQYVKATDEHGVERYLRVVVQPYIANERPQPELP